MKKYFVVNISPVKIISVALLLPIIRVKRSVLHALGISVAKMRKNVAKLGIVDYIGGHLPLF